MQSVAWLAVQVKSFSFASMWILSALLLLFFQMRQMALRFRPKKLTSNSEFKGKPCSFVDVILLKFLSSNIFPLFVLNLPIWNLDVWEEEGSWRCSINAVLHGNNTVDFMVASGKLNFLYFM